MTWKCGWHGWRKAFIRIIALYFFLQMSENESTATTSASTSKWWINWSLFQQLYRLSCHLFWRKRILAVVFVLCGFPWHFGENHIEGADFFPWGHAHASLLHLVVVFINGFFNFCFNLSTGFISINREETNLFAWNFRENGSWIRKTNYSIHVKNSKLIQIQLVPTFHLWSTL